MNKLTHLSSMQDVCSTSGSPMHASFEYPSIGLSDVLNEEVNAAQGVPPTNNPYSNTYNYGWKNLHDFSWRPQNVANPQA